MQEFLEIGQIVSTNGIKGLVNVNPFTEEPKRFETYKRVYIVRKDELIETKIESVRYHKNQVVLKLEKIDDIDTAQKYKGYFLKIRREDAAELPKDSYYIVDLIGLDVYTEQNLLLGKLADVFQTGSNDVYVVKDENGKEILLPAIKDVIKNIDIENGKMIVKLLEGLE